jgi:hypothetical protein
MNQYNISLTSTLSTLSFPTNQSSPIGKNTFMRYAQVIYVATLVTLGVCGNILCAIVFCTKSLRSVKEENDFFR